MPEPVLQIISTVVFDLGNVIAHFDHRRACRQMAALSSRRLGEDDVFATVFGSSLEYDFDCGRLSSAEFIQELRARLAIEASDAALTEAWSDIFWPNDDVVALVADLRTAGVRLVLASNTNALHFARIREQFGETIARFDALVLSYELGLRKPAPGFFERCVAAAGAPASACLYVDDRPDFIEAARTLGIPGLTYTVGLPLREHLRAAGVPVR